MATHADYFKNGELMIAKIIEMTGRREIIAVDGAFSGVDYPLLSKATKISELCNLIATSESRIGAVVVAPKGEDLIYKRFLKRVRQLTSAEGAALIWEGNEALQQFYEIKADYLVQGKEA